MNEVHIVLNWLMGHKEILALLAVIAAGVGALYRPVRDLIIFIPKLAWVLIKFAFLTIWYISWPIRRPIAWLYTEHLSGHVDNFFGRIFDWYEKREDAKEKLRATKDSLKVTDL